MTEHTDPTDYSAHGTAQTRRVQPRNGSLR